MKEDRVHTRTPMHTHRGTGDRRCSDSFQDVWICCHKPAFDEVSRDPYWGSNCVFPHSSVQHPSWPHWQSLTISSRKIPHRHVRLKNLYSQHSPDTFSSVLVINLFWWKLDDIPTLVFLKAVDWAAGDWTIWILRTNRRVEHPLGLWQHKGN